MDKCSTCKHWTEDSPYPNFCDRMKDMLFEPIVLDPSDPEGYPRFPFSDVHNFVAVLRPRFDFGCVLHESK